MTAKAIETRYAGHRFRSRLEARWAIFFDTLGIPWQYEPEGFELAAGRYLPDFYLPQQRLYYEVKGRRYNDHEQQLIWQLYEATGTTTALAWGNLPRNPDINGYDLHSRSGDAGHRGIIIYADYDYAWTACPEGKHFGLEYEARGARVNCECPKGEWADKQYWGNHPRITHAYENAHSARFEHGETPDPAALRASGAAIPAREPRGVVVAREALARARHA